MEDEIKVNEYVRTKLGHIRKIEANEYNNPILRCEYYGDKIVKHSSNLIDLIQCGDYVNGEKVCKSRYDELYTSYVYCGGIGVRTTEAYTTFIKDMKEQEIESIVTKEQFESISYKVTKM